MTRFLDTELLEELEQRWRANGARIVDHLRPGLSDAEIDRIAADLPFSLPEEVRRWYRWHNGSPAYEMAPARACTSLEEDVEFSRGFQGDDEALHRRALIISTDKPYIVLDCRDGASQPVSVWNVWPDEPDPDEPVFHSLGDFVAAMIGLIDDGYMFVRDGNWAYRDPLPPEVERLIP